MVKEPYVYTVFTFKGSIHVFVKHLLMVSLCNTFDHILSVHVEYECLNLKFSLQND